MRDSKRLSEYSSELSVDLGTRSYRTRIGSGMISELSKCLEDIPVRSKRIFIIADEALASIRTQVLQVLSQGGFNPMELPVKSGEPLKNFEKVHQLYGELIEKKADRDSVILALGGGTVGDVAGFIASTYLRGLSWVGLPTTLLAQVDSCIGGKTGVNYREGKNIIGTFYQPSLVVCDIDFLKTLPTREIVSGFGEMVKVALAYDRDYYEFLKVNHENILCLKPDVLALAIKRSLFWKSKVISQDEQDRLGVRETLNFGHTFAHALETATKYEIFRHGEAVLWGLRFALALSEIKGILKPVLRQSLDSFLELLPVPAIPIPLLPETVFHSMGMDKKKTMGKGKFLLLEDVGKIVQESQVLWQDLIRSWNLLLKLVPHE